MDRYFLSLSDDELIKKIEVCNKKITEYEKPIKEYDKNLKIFKETIQPTDKGNPIVLQDLGGHLKVTPSGDTKYIMLKDSYFKTINENSDANRRYVLNKEGNRFFYTEKMEHWVKNKRKMELILRARKREKEQTDNVGCVYVFSNKSLPKNTFKIGSTYGNPDERAEELTGTGHLYPFKTVFKIKIKAAEYYEKKIHSLLDNYRVKQNREFFEIDLDKIKNCLKQVSEISEKGSKKITLTNLKKKISL